MTKAGEKAGLTSNTRLIPLTQGHSATVDAADFAELSRYKWRAMRKKYTFYAIRSIKSKRKGEKRFFQMHRVVMGIDNPSITIDHRDGNGLNNSRSNIRICNKTENNANARKKSNSTMPYKGIKRTVSGRWGAQISYQRKRIWMGLFDSPEEAARAYDEAARQLFGKFARPNFEETP